MSVVLGLDLGTKSGFCRIDTEKGSVVYGENDWSALPTEDRVIEFGNWLKPQLLYDKTPTVVGFEEVSFAQGKGAWIIHRQEGVLHYLCQEIAYVGVHNGQLKVFATEDGKASKKAMIHAAKYGLAYLGLPVPKKLTDNEADAILVAFHVAKNSLKGGWTP